MIRDPYSKLNALQKKVDALQGETMMLHFTDGDTLKITDKQNSDLMHDVMNNIPNDNITFILDKLDNGIEDHEGVCHLLYAYTIDPIDLWSDDE